ncbi:hypothetical protein Tdes44962_MAKER09942 [Teratosphaeria destructans]|uniref:Uncharacterized protein n=1 Tax=Teratosphaeria destructans TaxID=418781 RepID=A0A9W7W1H6_9PEZI|nr:hypothetical protein Tdes44962_MAKER09942 [Teratosphaeria destructans]
MPPTPSGTFFDADQRLAARVGGVEAPGLKRRSDGTGQGGRALKELSLLSLLIRTVRQESIHEIARGQHVDVGSAASECALRLAGTECAGRLNGLPAYTRGTLLHQAEICFTPDQYVMAIAPRLQLRLMVFVPAQRFGVLSLEEGWGCTLQRSLSRRISSDAETESMGRARSCPQFEERHSLARKANPRSPNRHC